MNILILGIFVAAAFLLQALMGYFQIRNFARNYHAVRQEGRVLIGKNPRRFRQGSLMLIGLDHNDRIQEIRVMKGLTVFSRFREIAQFDGELVAEVGADYTALQKLSMFALPIFNEIGQRIKALPDALAHVFRKNTI